MRARTHAHIHIHTRAWSPSPRQRSIQHTCNDICRTKIVPVPGRWRIFVLLFSFVPTKNSGTFRMPRGSPFRGKKNRLVAREFQRRPTWWPSSSSSPVPSTAAASRRIDFCPAPPAMTGNKSPVPSRPPPGHSGPCAAVTLPDRRRCRLGVCPTNGRNVSPGPASCRIAGGTPAGNSNVIILHQRFPRICFTTFPSAGLYDRKTQLIYTRNTFHGANAVRAHILSGIFVGFYFISKLFTSTCT